MNKIELSPQILAGLYPSSLVLADENIPAAAGQQMDRAAIAPPSKTKTADTTAVEWKTLGGNKKNILIAVNYPGTAFLPDNELAFLTNMLSACKLSLDDVSIINIAPYKLFNYKDLIGHYKSNKVFLFGIEPADFGLPVSFPAFQVQSFSGCTYLFAPTLEESKDDKLLKSKLWVCLQRIFAI
jgi:hypothetical protein